MPNPTDATVAELERDWPKWQIWVVYQYIGGIVWCARRWDDEKHVLNAASAQALVEQLAQAEADPDCGACFGTGYVHAGRSEPERCQLCAGQL